MIGRVLMATFDLVAATSLAWCLVAEVAGAIKGRTVAVPRTVRIISLFTVLWFMGFIGSLLLSGYSK